jgi:D-3-phosphoglycerate dehydrogenase
MAKQFKVIRVDKKGANAVLIEEVEELAQVDADLEVVEYSTEEELISLVNDADVVITSVAAFTRKVIDGLPKCRAIIRYGVGYDSVDVEAATDNGIIVVNVPDFCWEEVSNHAIALQLACAKKLVLLDNLTRQGRWAEAKKALSPMVSIHDQILGIVGCGNIGRMTAGKAQCFGLKIMGYDPYLKETVATESGISLVSLTELLKESDFVSVHIPLTRETRHMFGEPEFKQMKPTAYFINTARGAVVDEPALIKALQQGWIAGAGLDVFEKEPVEPDNPLLMMDNTVVLPHTASYCDVAFSRLRRSVGQEAVRIISGQWPKNVVNKSVKPRFPILTDN